MIDPEQIEYLAKFIKRNLRLAPKNQADPNCEIVLNAICDQAKLALTARSQALEEAAALLDSHGVEGGVIYAERLIMQRRIRALTTPASPEETR